jgi:regulator of PEP synthase PpsR (kinase-PPPase family)
MDTVDVETSEPQPERKRGRPSTGKALSASQRQARRREKLKAEGKAILPPTVVTQEVEAALSKFIQFKDMTLGDALDRIVRDRLLRKRSGKRKRKEPTHG